MAARVDDEEKKEACIRKFKRYYQTPSIPPSISQIKYPDIKDMMTVFVRFYPVGTMNGIALPKECSRFKILKSIHYVLEKQKPDYQTDFFEVAIHLAVHGVEKLPTNHQVTRADVEGTMGNRYIKMVLTSGVSYLYAILDQIRRKEGYDGGKHYFPPIPEPPFDKVSYSNYDLPEGYKGKNLFLRDTIKGFMEDNPGSCPWTEIE